MCNLSTILLLCLQKMATITQVDRHIIVFLHQGESQRAVRKKTAEDMAGLTYYLHQIKSQDLQKLGGKTPLNI